MKRIASFKLILFLLQCFVGSFYEITTVTRNYHNVDLFNQRYLHPSLREYYPMAVRLFLLYSSSWTYFSLWFSRNTFTTNITRSKKWMRCSQLQIKSWQTVSSSLIVTMEKFLKKCTILSLRRHIRNTSLNSKHDSWKNMAGTSTRTLLSSLLGNSSHTLTNPNTSKKLTSTVFQ